MALSFLCRGHAKTFSVGDFDQLIEENLIVLVDHQVFLRGLELYCAFFVVAPLLLHLFVLLGRISVPLFGHGSIRQLAELC